MEAAVTFEAEVREAHGKGNARALRREGKVPVIIYGKGKANVSVAVDGNQLNTEYYHGGFMSKIVEIKAGKDSYMALAKDIQLHPVSDRIEHADFVSVDEKSTITVQVPVHFLNQDRCVGLKRGGAMNVVRHDLELVCKVTNIPKSVEIDIASMNIGDSLHISHIDLPEGVTPSITDRDFTIATITGRGAKKAEAAEGEGDAAEGEEAKAE